MCATKLLKFQTTETKSTSKVICTFFQSIRRCRMAVSPNGRGFLHEIENMYEYNQLLFPTQFPACHMDQIQEVDLSPEDVIIVGYPRSGV